MLKIAVLVSGGGTNLQAIIDSITSKKIDHVEISVVISNNKNAYALQRAHQHGIPALCISPKDYNTRKLFHKALLDTLTSYQVELIVLAGYLVVIPEEMIEAYPNQMINIHPSLIPAFCGTGCYGLKVHEESLKRGVKVAGATVHFVDKGTDTGPIILQKAVAVPQGITPKELQQKVMEEAEWEILPRAIHLIANHQVQIKGNQVYLKDTVPTAD